MERKEIIIRRIKFPHGEKNVVILKETIDHITPCATKYSICFYTRNNRHQGFVGLYEYIEKIGIDGGTYDESWKMTKQINYEAYDIFIILADELF